MVIKIIICILAVICLVVGLIDIIVCLINLVALKKRMTGEHYCKDCKEEFLVYGEEKYKYCPYCGQRLTKYVPKDEE